MIVSRSSITNPPLFFTAFISDSFSFPPLLLRPRSERHDERRAREHLLAVPTDGRHAQHRHLRRRRADLLLHGLHGRDHRLMRHAPLVPRKHNGLVRDAQLRDLLRLCSIVDEDFYCAVFQAIDICDLGRAVAVVVEHVVAHEQLARAHIVNRDPGLGPIVELDIVALLVVR